VNITEIDNTPLGSLERLNFLAVAVNALISPDPLRKEFLAHERLVRTLFQAVKPDPSVVAFVSRVICLSTIADAIREKTGEGRPANISGILASVNRLLDESIAADGFTIHENEEGYGVIDLSKIDFAALTKRFGKSKTKSLELEQLKAAIRVQLDTLVRFNRTRADYLVKFEELIESYNAGSRNIEELFNELLALSRSLTEEQQRHVREQLSEEELTIFDLLTRPGPDLSAEEREEVKKVARQILERLNKLLVLDWRKRSGTLAQVRLAIEDVLDFGLPRAYSPDVYQQKCAVVFEHVYESYPDQGL
jgi:type I restriction enzyme R subunit